MFLSFDLMDRNKIWYCPVEQEVKLPLDQALKGRYTYTAVYLVKAA